MSTNIYGYPFMGYPNIKSPQELDAQTKSLLEQYNNAYGKLNASMAPQNVYIKVKSYDEVKSAVPNEEGKPLVFLDETNMMMYSKKVENGATYTQAFMITPTDLPQEETKSSFSNDDIMTLLSKMNERLERLEENGQSNTTNASDDASKAKS